jgi:alkylhydroperoxidase family enzyme
VTVSRSGSGVIIASPPSCREEVITLARKAAADPSDVTAEDLDAVRHLGWNDAEIIEALAMACHAGWTNTFAQGLRLEDDLIAPEFAAYF